MSWFSHPSETLRKAVSNPGGIPGMALGGAASPLTWGTGLLAVKGLGAVNPAYPTAPGYENTPNPLTGYNSPTFDYSRIDSAMNSPLRGADTFNQGQDLLKTNYLDNPETKQMLSGLDSQGSLLYNKLTSGASSLAAKRGLTGSSIEQFGVNQAGQSAGQATIDARNQILLQAAQRQSDARNLAANALFNRSASDVGMQTTRLGGEYGLAGEKAQLNSDEVASLRNMMLGNQGTQLGYQNVAQADKASQRANNPLNLLIGGASSGATAAIAPF